MSPVPLHAEQVMKAVGKHLHGRFRGAVHGAAGIGRIAGHGTDVDDVALQALHHTRNDEAGHIEQPLHVGFWYQVEL